MASPTVSSSLDFNVTTLPMVSEKPSNHLSKACGSLLDAINSLSEPSGLQAASFLSAKTPLKL